MSRPLQGWDQLEISSELWSPMAKRKHVGLMENKPPAPVICHTPSENPLQPLRLVHERAAVEVDVLHVIHHGAHHGGATAWNDATRVEEARKRAVTLLCGLSGAFRVGGGSGKGAEVESEQRIWEMDVDGG